MPELGEVSYYQEQWALHRGQRVVKVLGHPKARIFRNNSLHSAQSALINTTLNALQRRAKWANFHFDKNLWLSIHLGMSGELKVLNSIEEIDKHTHLNLVLENQKILSFRDPRMFGSIILETKKPKPEFWNQFGPEVSSKEFNKKYFHSLCVTKRNTPVKAFLLEQKFFPGVGNWMADEILWRSQIDPERKILLLATNELEKLFLEVKFICRYSEKNITKKLNKIPKDWLFWKRWDQKLGPCPQCGHKLSKKTVGGRSSVFCSNMQK